MPMELLSSVCEIFTLLSLSPTSFFFLFLSPALLSLLHIDTNSAISLHLDLFSLGSLPLIVSWCTTNGFNYWSQPFLSVWLSTLLTLNPRYLCPFFYSIFFGMGGWIWFCGMNLIWFHGGFDFVAWAWFDFSCWFNFFPQ